MDRVLLSVVFFAALTLPVLGFGGDAESFTLKAGGLQIEFDLARKGGITSLRNGEVDVVAPGWEAPTLFRIAYVQRQRVMEYRSLDFDRFEYEKLPSGIRFHHTGLKDQEIQVISTVESKADYISFTSEVRSGPETVAAHLIYPYVSGYESLSGDPDADVYVLPQASGELHRNPVLELRRGRKPMLANLGYPGAQGVQFHALYNEKGGIVMYAADPQSNPKQFNLHYDTNTDSVGWLVLHYFDETPGFLFKQSYEVRVQASGSSWYDAADIYAEWSRKQWWMKKKVDFPDWLLRMPMLASVHDNENWARVIPSWIAEHQPEMNKLLGSRPLVNQFQRWEHYGMWIAPDSFPPIGGEQAMIEASKNVRSSGNHLKHLFSSGQYWLHEDVTDEYFEEHIKNMAIMPRRRQDRKALVGRHPQLGEFVLTCPSSEEYHAKLVHLANKLCDYNHDFFSMDIWPAGQPRPCYNPRHNHPPGLGKWYVDGNISLLNKLHAAVYPREPQAVFGGEHMAEPYMPWMHVALMRSAMAPLDPSNKHLTRIPMYDYIYGDQVILWGSYATTRFPSCRAELSIQFVRGKLLHVTDKWSPRFFSRESTVRGPADESPRITLKKGITLGDDAVRAADLAFAAKANDIQRGPFNSYFARGRVWRFPESFANTENESNWRKLSIYSKDPAVGSLRHPENDNILWALGNGREKRITVRLRPLKDKSIARTTLTNKPGTVDLEGEEYVELVLEPLELGVVEWK